MTDDNKEFQSENPDEFKFEDDEVNQFFDEIEEPQADMVQDESKAQKFKNKLGGLGSKFSFKKPSFNREKLPGKLKDRRVLLGIVFVILVIIIYLFLGGGSSSSNDRLSGTQIQPLPPAPMQAQPQHALSDSQVQQLNSSGSAAKPASFAVQGLNPAEQTKPMAMPAEPASMPNAAPVNIAGEFTVPTPAAVNNPQPIVSGISKAQLNTALSDLTAALQTASNQQLLTIANKIDMQYGQLNAANQKLTDQMNRLQQQVADLKNAVSKSHQNIQNLQGKVSDIENGYAGSFNANGTTTYQNVPKPEKVVKAPSTVTYVVQAIVPGRAWLYSSQGQTVSVGVGDKVEGYGSVMSIDSLTGTVTMSNGTALTPGA